MKRVCFKNYVYTSAAPNHPSSPLVRFSDFHKQKEVGESDYIPTTISPEHLPSHLHSAPPPLFETPIPCSLLLSYEKLAVWGTYWRKHKVFQIRQSLVR